MRLSPKYQAKIVTRPKQEAKIVTRTFPDRWEDFARLCDIRAKRIQKFDPYYYQIELINFIEATPTSVITKTRQLGFTEAIANYFLWKACRNPAYLGAIFSKGKNDTSNIANRVRRHIESLEIETKTDAVTDIELIDGGRLTFRNSTIDGARGLEAVHDLLFDEAAFVRLIEELYGNSTATATVMGADARIIILSTPNGQSGWYWDKLNTGNGDRDILQICDRIKREEIEPVQSWHDENGTGKFICHWLAHPEFSKQKDTYLSDIKKRLQISEAKLQQEYNLSFAEGEQIVFNPQLVRERAIAQWEEPQPDGIYYLAVDTTLYGDDYCVAGVLKEIEPGLAALIAMYRSRKKTNQIHIYEIGNLIKQYNPIKVAIEVNSGGRIYYENLSEEFLNTEFVEIKTTGSSKPAMVTKVILALESGSLTYPDDSIIINEFLSFRKDDGKLEAVSGQHDDIVMMLCFGCAIFPMKF